MEQAYVFLQTFNIAARSGSSLKELPNFTAFMKWRLPSSYTSSVTSEAIVINAVSKFYSVTSVLRICLE